MSWADCDRVYAWLEAGHGEKLTTLDRGILLSMAYAANTGTGLAWLGQDRLAARWGVTTGAVKRTIRRLHEHGLIVTVERGLGHRRARYALAGELLRVTDGSPYPESRGTEESPYSESRGTEEPKKGDRTAQVGGPYGPFRVTDGSPGSVVITEDHQSIIRDDGRTDGADAPPPPPGQTDDDEQRSNNIDPARIDAEIRKAAAEGTRDDLLDLIATDEELLTEIATRLNLSSTAGGTAQDWATDWAVDKLDGRKITTSVRAYLRACLRNHKQTDAEGQGDTNPPHPDTDDDNTYRIPLWLQQRIAALDEQTRDALANSIRPWCPKCLNLVTGLGYRIEHLTFHDDCQLECRDCGAPFPREHLPPDDLTCTDCRNGINS